MLPQEGAGGPPEPHATGRTDGHLLAESLPERTFWLVGDSAYINSELMQGRPENLQVLGPLRWDAALYEVPGPYGGKGRPPKKGKRLPTPWR